MNESWEGFSGRIKKLNPLFFLGKGLNVGELNAYVPTILLQVILVIFYRELNDDTKRTKSDILLIVKETLQAMNFTYDDNQAQRLTDGLLHYGQANLNQPFEAPVYNDETHSWDKQVFRYLTMDELYTNRELGGSTVYKLTDIAQEMVFMSREMSEEFSITIEQLYSIQLIKNGNFKKAIRNLDNLIARVNRLIAEENHFLREMQNNPKILVLNEHLQREDKKEKIDKQFEEEKTNFKMISSLLEKAKVSENYQEIQDDVMLLHEKIDYTRQLHDRFANSVIQNIAFEINLKTENPHLFWDKPIASFKEDVYENWLLKKGCQNFDVIENILSPLFSPKNEFIFPLDWAWGEQEFYEIEVDEDEEDEDEETQDFLEKRITDWDSVIEAWEYVFEHLLEYEEFSLSALKDLPYNQQDTWFEENETFEIWMMFSQKPFNIQPFKEHATFNDEREILIHGLMKKNARLKKLEGKSICAEFDEQEKPIRWYDNLITPFKLVIKENTEL